MEENTPTIDRESLTRLRAIHPRTQRSGVWTFGMTRSDGSPVIAEIYGPYVCAKRHALRDAAGLGCKIVTVESWRKV